MSRSQYVDALDQDELARWRGAVTRAIRGRRGQAFLRELIRALETMAEKRLISGALEDDSDVCAIGAVGRCRGMDMSRIDYEDPIAVAAAFGIAHAMAAEIEYENDEAEWRAESPEERWERMRRWAVKHLVAEAPEAP